jgi:hypothetical protein
VEGKSRTLTGNGGKASDLGPKEWAAPLPPFDSRPLSMSMADVEAEVRRERERFAEARATPSHEEWCAEYLRTMAKQAQELQERFDREHTLEQEQRLRDERIRAEQAEQARAVSEVESPRRRRWWPWS